MFAVIATGGKQYTVSVGDKIKVEKLDVEAGKKVKFDVLLISDENGVVAGNPIVTNINQRKMNAKSKDIDNHSHKLKSCL